MLKLDLIPQNMNQTDYCPKKKRKKAVRLMKDKSGGKVMIDFVRLRAKFIVIPQIMVVKKKNVKGAKKVCQKKKI